MRILHQQTCAGEETLRAWFEAVVQRGAELAGVEPQAPHESYRPWTALDGQGPYPGYWEAWLRMAG